MDASRPPRRPFVLLALMTVAAFGGPLVFGFFLRGGRSPKWPPDRAVEWAALLGTSGLVLALMIISVSLMVANQRAVARIRGESSAIPSPDPRETP